jgi:type IV pilus assembly protein PilA
MKKQQGFTLIELMIVVAIIGILAAIAIPQYQNYIARTQINRAVGEISSLKTAVEENLMRGVTNFTQADLGYTGSSISTFRIAAASAGGGGAATAGTFAADGGGILEVELTNVSTAITGTIIVLARTPAGAWSCTIDNTDPDTATTWNSTFLPAGCTIQTAAVAP